MIFESVAVAHSHAVFLDAHADAEFGESTLMAMEAVPSRAVAKGVKACIAPFGLVTGAVNGHPMIHAQNFEYCNSDGSSSDVNLGRVDPTRVLAKFIHDTALHGDNGEH